tara:strand:+ start:129 stop:386 length:258 start_codon:yes stop_codon:yes gene_type:complete
MCLAVPGKIIKITNDIATLDYGSELRTGKILDNTLKVGDYAIVQGGIIIQKIEKKEAEESLKLYNQAIQQTERDKQKATTQQTEK